MPRVEGIRGRAAEDKSDLFLKRLSKVVCIKIDRRRRSSREFKTTMSRSQVDIMLARRVKRWKDRNFYFLLNFLIFFNNKIDELYKNFFKF